jgi:hypothetical protein
MNNKRQAFMLFVGGLKKQAMNSSQLKKLRKIVKVPVKLLRAPFGMLRRMIRPPMIDLSIFLGVEKSSQQSFSVVLGLTKQHRHYWLDLLFEGNTQELSAHRVQLKEAFQAEPVKDVESDLTVMFVDHADFERENRCGWFFIPEWIYGEMAIPLPKKCLSQEKVKSDLRRIRQNRFEYVVSHDPDVYDDFYFNMHIPYISKAHGNMAFFDSLAERRKFSKDYDLLLIKKMDKPELYVAGITIIYELGLPKLWMVGVRDGDDYARQGVIAALYHFSFQYLVSKGFDSVGVGGSKALLNDGVLKFKQKMAQKIVRGSKNGYAIKINTLSTAVVCWLKNNPFVFKRDSALHAAVFVEASEIISDKYFRECYKKYFQVGIASMTIYCFGDIDVSIGSLIPDDLAGFIQLRPAVDLLVAR